MERKSQPESDQRLIDPILSASLSRLRATHDRLTRSEGDDHRDAAIQLCKLSRDIRFRLGAPGHVSFDFVREVVDLFVRACDDINQSDDELMKWRRQLQERASQMEDSYGREAFVDDSLPPAKPR